MTEVINNENTKSKEELSGTVGVVALDKNGNVLVVRHNLNSRQKDGVYSLPGGHREEQETEIQAAKREFEEETGLTIDENSLGEFSGNQFTGKIGKGDSLKIDTLKVFLCTNFQGTLKGEESGKTHPEWVRIKDLNLIYESLPNVLEAVNNASKFLNEKH